MNGDQEYPKGRIAVSIIAGIGWLIFALIYTLLWWNNFDLIQSIIILIITFLIVGALIGVMWVLSGSKKS